MLFDPPTTPRPEPPKWEEEDVWPERAYIQVRLSEGGGRGRASRNFRAKDAKKLSLRQKSYCILRHSIPSHRQGDTRRRTDVAAVAQMAGSQNNPLPEESCSTRHLLPPWIQ